MTKKPWKYYLPDSGETAEDATEMATPWGNPFCAAEEACRDEYDNRDGLGNGPTREFRFVVINPWGAEFAFIGTHEASVNHYVRKDKPHYARKDEK